MRRGWIDSSTDMAKWRECLSKRVFRRKAEAVAMIRHNVAVGHSAQRAYKCGYCRKWHLTSRTDQ